MTELATRSGKSDAGVSQSTASSDVATMDTEMTGGQSSEPMLFFQLQLRWLARRWYGMLPQRPVFSCMPVRMTEPCQFF